MANENNNINELVSKDDDPTAELEVLHDESCDDLVVYSEADANTYDAIDELRSGAAKSQSMERLEVDLIASRKTISRLQFDTEQLHAKLLGLGTEVAARNDQTQQLIDDRTAQRDALARKEKLIKKRDIKIRSLISEIRQREEEHQALIADFGELQKVNNESLAITESSNCERVDAQYDIPADLQRKLNHSNEYADTLRRQLQDILESTRNSEADRNYLQRTLTDTAERNSELERSVDRAKLDAADLQSRLDAVAAEHQNEIRLGALDDLGGDWRRQGQLCQGSASIKQPI